MHNIGFVAWLLSMSLLALAATDCSAVPTADAQPMAVGAPTAPPAGFIGFCMTYPDQCGAGAPQRTVVDLTLARRQELEAVQDRVNRTIKPRAEPANVWDFPKDGYGDCNRYALEKRRELIARGWPRDALLLAVAMTERNEGHLVLIARTDAGDLVLDNRLARVVDWTALPYRWISRQSGANPAQWVSILGESPRRTASLGAGAGAPM